MMKIFTTGLAIMSMFAAPACATSPNAFNVTSQDIFEGVQLSVDNVFKGFGCEGKNMSPQLSWTAAPEGTKSFVVTAYDPDAPTGSGWWHWVAFDIPANVNSLTENASANGSLPKAVIQARSDFGTHKFGGACPPPGEVHRYKFTVYALDVDTLGLDATASPALVGFMTKSHAIASDTITAIYTR